MSKAAHRYIEPVGAQPALARWKEQLQMSRQQGQTQFGFSATSSMFSPYRMYRQSPQSWPNRLSHCEQFVRLPSVF